MKWLPEWRAEISKFLTSKLNEQTNKTVVDIGVGDSTPHLYNLIGNNLTVFDRIVHKDKKLPVNYIEGDIQKEETFGENKFDIVSACEVFEHTEYPWLVAKNLVKLAKEKILVTVPTILAHHPGLPWYNDYWRFYPGAITNLFYGLPVTVEEKTYKCKEGIMGLSAVITLKE